MSLFPMFLKLEGRRCLVVGAGKVGEGKIRKRDCGTYTSIANCNEIRSSSRSDSAFTILETENVTRVFKHELIEIA